MAADESSVNSTLLSLSLHPSPGISRSREATPDHVDLCPSVWCFNSIKADQQHPISSTSAIPNLQEFTLLSPSTLSNPSFSDALPDKNDRDLYNPANIGIIPSLKRKTQEVDDPKPNTTEYDSHSTITSDNERVAKKQKLENPPTGQDDGHWIKKRLTISDVNSSRLLLAKQDMKKYVVSFMDEERSAACQCREGLRVKIWDLDTLSENELSLKQWKTRSFLLTTNWSMEFVKRRSLQESDYIGLRWDIENLRFLFHKFNAQS